MEIPIGFNTGCLYRTELSVEDRIKLFHAVGARALEISFNRARDLRGFTLSQDTVDEVDKYDFVTLHAPCLEEKYKEDEWSIDVLERLKIMVAHLGVKHVVFHPDDIEDYDFIRSQDLHICVENMDKRKKFGNTLKDIAFLASKGYDFVLDVQHAYETGISIKELVEVMGVSKIKYIHASGQTQKEMHWGIQKSPNRSDIIESLKQAPRRPIILEGILEPTVPELSAELAMMYEFGVVKHGIEKYEVD
ncbi:sugar phosphate isomerase/epimerase [Candidatus Woesearchaeota archaeon]|nr:sugar phosphate isomerase/epimerase [Candidatus Woesearchaeota archaeon]MBW3021962.1 sugar phosphate isomerase/epimerase [Candidatus Woesearchaeota archaeon]